MRRYLISFPSDAMDSIPEMEMSDVDAAAHAVVDEAKDAGVYIFSGGLFDDVVPVLVAADGTVTTATYPRPRTSTGGSPLSRCPRGRQPFEWAAKIAAACRCTQEVREFGSDPRV